MMRPILCLGTIILGLRAAEAFAQQPQGPFYGRHMWDGPWHSWFLGPLFMIAFMLLAALIVALLVRWVGGGNRRSLPDSHRKAPIDILRERFAQGEIDKEDFEERRRILED